MSSLAHLETVKPRAPSSSSVMGERPRGPSISPLLWLRGACPWPLTHMLPAHGTLSVATQATPLRLPIQDGLSLGSSGQIPLPLYYLKLRPFTAHTSLLTGAKPDDTSYHNNNIPYIYTSFHHSQSSYMSFPLIFLPIQKSFKSGIRPIFQTSKLRVREVTLHGCRKHNLRSQDWALNLWSLYAVLFPLYCWACLPTY